jgi:DNA primase
VILVEGYMDAIALWGIGVKEVVASMGTAISSDQLASVAKLSGSPGGRVILCLDNDEAGQIAVERLCGNGMLSKLIAGVEIGCTPEIERSCRFYRSEV